MNGQTSSTSGGGEESPANEGGNTTSPSSTSTLSNTFDQSGGDDDNKDDMERERAEQKFRRGGGDDGGDEEDDEQELPGVSIFCGGLPRRTREKDLRELFEPFGTLHSVIVALRRLPENDCKGYGFVQMDLEDAQKAIEKLNGTAAHPLSLRSRSLLTIFSIRSLLRFVILPFWLHRFIIDRFLSLRRAAHR